MSFYRLSRTARSLRHRQSSLSAAHTYIHSPLLLADSSRHSGHLFQVSENFHSINQFYKDSNSFRSIGAYHRLLQYSSFSTLPSDEKREESKLSKGNECDRSWIDIYLPEKARPYARLARLDKPIGTWLLAWPCMWSITMAAAPGSLPDIKMMMLFGTGALLLRGAGCTINDLLDRDIDTKVVIILIPHIIVCSKDKVETHCKWCTVTISGTLFSWFSIAFGVGNSFATEQFQPCSGSFISAASIFISSDEETDVLAESMSVQPQAYLGLTFNWGALLGWAAVRGSLDLAVVIPLYASGVFWTLVYDTIYAHQDKEDDMIVGVKSTALRFADSTKEWISGFGAACIGSLALSGYNANLEWTYYIFLAAGSTQLAWQILTVDLSSRADCSRK
ncbi:hypothetical protein SASPL_114474 [Salvia splendens]|uniref:Uncharacterized protein n=1 Tax=Salvia splendens TaxID=180675 RepID=A0A8X9A0F0_SALSN|nr:hypothetical protein SASPL_114474 [Salvia splendens]